VDATGAADATHDVDTSGATGVIIGALPSARTCTGALGSTGAAPACAVGAIPDDPDATADSSVTNPPMISSCE
jgi:hypothetical protein